MFLSCCILLRKVFLLRGIVSLLCRRLVLQCSRVLIYLGFVMSDLTMLNVLLVLKLSQSWVRPVVVLLVLRSILHLWCCAWLAWV
jgi:type III secretory pathway component EscR